MAPSTFASAAAAGSNSNPSRNEGSGEWSRRANGATQTFRRPSVAPTTTNSAHQRDGSASQPRTSTDSPGVYIPPHLNASRNGTASEHRYSKDQLLQLFKSQTESEIDGDALSNLFLGGWEPNITNGNSSASWGRRDEPKDTHGADLCWDRGAQTVPLGLNGFTEEEKDVFSGSVNSPLKPPTTTNKDGTPKEVASHRKISISQSINSPGGYGVTSPTSARPRNARRETSEAYPFPPSPSASSRFSRDESSAATPPPALLRRRTDMKDSPAGSGTEERDKDRSINTEALPFVGLKRSVTGGLGGASPSTWTPNQGTGFGAMGSFGNFALGTGAGQPTAVADKRPGFGSMRGESRFKGLMAKGSSEDVRRDMKEKASMGSLSKASEHDKGNPSWMETRFNRPTSDGTDPFPEEDLPTGSAALNGALDTSPPQQRGFSGFGNSGGNDDAGFSAFGMTSDTIGDAVHQTPHRNQGGHEQMSPTDTNPYQSPENDKTELDEVDTDGSDIQRVHLPGLGGFGNNQGGLPGLGGFGGVGRIPGAFEIAASDRSQTSSVGPGGRGFPSLGGLGGLPGLGGSSAWSAAQGGMGTPTRERAGFGGAFSDGLYGSMAELQSPVLAGLGSGGGFAAAPSSGLGGTIGRGSKMGSLFPLGMQEQMRSAEQGRQGSDEMPLDSFDRQQPGFGSFGRSAFGPNALGAGSARESDSPFRSGRGLFDELLASASRNEGQTPIGEPTGHSQLSGNGPTPVLSTQVSQEPLGMHRTSQPQLNRQPSLVASPGSGNPPVSQIRQMVMPDRMRWIYKDPQGNTQGPWSGLEMHDWYKAGFFTPELLIKRLEDPEFEPLAQLIRRIGNSREPFLVPQIGVPHEPPAGQGRGVQGPAAPGAQPPFASSFPSFGTTLTAEQQNALERRKQEEQYLMARQKEHLAQQQLLIKQMHVSGQQHGILPQLNHHSSAHSLHSQPSFGSITSPSGYQPSPTQGPMTGGQPVPGFFDNSFRSAPSGGMGPIGAGGEMLGNIREDEIPGMMERLNLGRGGQQGPGTFGQNQSHDAHAQQVAAMLNDRARLEREQADHDARQQGFGQEEYEGQQAADRFQHFRNLRAQAEHELQQSGPSREEREQAEAAAVKSQIEQAQRDQPRATDIAPPAEPQSLTQQVQAAASAKQAVAQQTWAKVDMSTMEPLQHPPQSSSPMPAPIAQRKQNLVETLAEESRSRTQSPSVETPSASVAPWAKESVEAPKAQSLKEIQEAEAKRAAKHEELAAAQRRAAFERELTIAQAAANSAPAPGLPPGASWASAQSPAGSVASGPSVWGAKTVSKPSSKTLQQIQKEEEAKKQRAATAAAVGAGISATVSTPQLSSGKRYADLASKSASPAPVVGGSAWSTVGAGGKVKAMPPLPTGPAVRAVSGTIPTTPAKPLMTTRSSTMTSAQMAKMSKADALDEFKKWASGELLRGQLSKEVSAPDFVEMLLNLGSDIEILTEAVHQNAKTLDSRHFAEEFVRRKKQADKGVVEPLGTASPVNKQAAENAWSAVAKKGQAPAVPAVAEPAFKMAKTKGRRK